MISKVRKLIKSVQANITEQVNPVLEHRERVLQEIFEYIDTSSDGGLSDIVEMHSDLLLEMECPLREYSDVELFFNKKRGDIIGEVINELR